MIVMVLLLSLFSGIMSIYYYGYSSVLLGTTYSSSEWNETSQVRAETFLIILWILWHHHFPPPPPPHLSLFIYLSLTDQCLCIICIWYQYFLTCLLLQNQFFFSHQTSLFLLYECTHPSPITYTYTYHHLSSHFFFSSALFLFFFISSIQPSYVMISLVSLSERGSRRHIKSEQRRNCWCSSSGVDCVDFE